MIGVGWNAILKIGPMDDVLDGEVSVSSQHMHNYSRTQQSTNKVDVGLVDTNNDYHDDYIVIMYKYLLLFFLISHHLVVCIQLFCVFACASQHCTPFYYVSK